MLSPLKLLIFGFIISVLTIDLFVFLKTFYTIKGTFPFNQKYKYLLSKRIVYFGGGGVFNYAPFQKNVKRHHWTRRRQFQEDRILLIWFSLFFLTAVVIHLVIFDLICAHVFEGYFDEKKPFSISVSRRQTGSEGAQMKTKRKTSHGKTDRSAAILVKRQKQVFRLQLRLGCRLACHKEWAISPLSLNGNTVRDTYICTYL